MVSVVRAFAATGKSVLLGKAVLRVALICRNLLRQILINDSSYQPLQQRHPAAALRLRSSSATNNITQTVYFISPQSTVVLFSDFLGHQQVLANGRDERWYVQQLEL